MGSTNKIPINLLLPEQINVGKICPGSVAVLTSGGVESAVLVGILPNYFRSVHPIYVRFGLIWEKIEQQFLANYLEAIKQPEIKALKVLDLPVGNIYKNHWSISGNDTPDANSKDEAVYLPGRNILFLAQTTVWCSSNQIPFIALGSLSTNPFPDASIEFFEQMENVLSAGLNFAITILRPFSKMHKEEVIQLGKDLPLHLTFSCIRPLITRGENTKPSAVHCGVCNKCAERQQAFLNANINDKTLYATPALVKQQQFIS